MPMKMLPQSRETFRNWKVLPGSSSGKPQGWPREQREGAAVPELCIVWPCPHCSYLPPVFYFYFPAGKLILPSHQPFILLWDLPRIKKVSSQGVTTAHSPQPTFWSESALCWRRKCAFWKSWRLHSLFSKHCISHQWVSSKLWEHLTQSGSVTLSWGVGSLQWCGEQITGNLEVILLFPALKGESGQYWVFLQRRFLGSFSLFVQSVSSVWAWLVSTSCSRHAVGPHSAVLPDQEGVCVL